MLTFLYPYHFKCVCLEAKVYLVLSVLGRARPFLFVNSRRHIHKTPPFQTSSSQYSSSEEEEMQERHEDCELPVVLNKRAVVVLTKLSSSQIDAVLHASSHQPDSSNEDSLNGSESDMQWEPEINSIESDFSGSEFKIRRSKRRRTDTNYRRSTRTKRTSRRRRHIYRISDSSTDGSTSNNESNRVENSPGEATLDDDDSTGATVLQENGLKTTIQSEERKTTESETKTTESDKSKSTELDKNKSAESGKSKNTEPEERKTNPDKKQTTESDKQKTLNSVASKTTPQVNTTTATSQSNTKTGSQSDTDKSSTLSADSKGK